MDAQLACVNASGKAGDLGPLKKGILLESTTEHSRKLLGSPMPAELQQLGKLFEFEMVVGANGRIWLDAGAPRVTVAVAQALRATQHLHDATAVRHALESVKARVAVT